MPISATCAAVAIQFWDLGAFPSAMEFPMRLLMIVPARTIYSVKRHTLSSNKNIRKHLMHTYLTRLTRIFIYIYYLQQAHHSWIFVKSPGVSKNILMIDIIPSASELITSKVTIFATTLRECCDAWWWCLGDQSQFLSGPLPLRLE